MMKINFLLVFAIISVFSACNVASRQGPPNIVFIMADDLGYEGLSVNGSLSYSTPNLDRMAAEGMRFTHCYSQSVCTPTRVQIMTGRYNFRNYKQFGFLDLNEKTFAHYLQDAGYKTCIAGKWQLGNGVEAPFLEGFDEYCVWQIYNHIAGKDNRGGRYANPKIYKNGKVLDENDGLYGPDLFTEFALEFMKNNRDHPFLLYYPMILTHDPFVPTPFSDEWSEDPFQKDTSFFSDMVEYTDFLVQKIKDGIDELGLTDDTYLFFTGDNGTHRSIYSNTDKGIVRGGKSLTHEYGIHVPMIAYSPKNITAGVISNAMVDFSDILPTMLAIAGIERPDKPVLDGVNILPVLRGEKEAVKNFIYGYYWTRGRDPLRVHEYVRTHDYKLYRDGRLFDPELDPEEKYCLEGSEYLSVIEDLNEKMNSIRKQK